MHLAIEITLPYIFFKILSFRAWEYREIFHIGNDYCMLQYSVISDYQSHGIKFKQNVKFSLQNYTCIFFI